MRGSSHERSGRAAGLGLVLALAGCGADGPRPPSVDPVVRAFPSGQRFQDQLEVRLHAEPAATIHFTFDGTSPAEPGAPRYEAPLVLTEDTLLSFVAQTEDGRWSAMHRELYERLVPVQPYRPPDRGLEVSDDALFFSADPEDQVLAREIEIRSVGLAPIDIAAVYIAPSGGYYEEGAFEVSTTAPLRLPPGRTSTLGVRYHVTKTLRTAALVLETTGQLAPEGVWVISLGGRLSPF